MLIQLQAHIRQSLHARSSSHVTRTGRAYQEPHLVFVHLRCAPCPPYAPPQQDLRYTLNPVYSHPYVTEAASRQCQLFLYFNSSQKTYTHRAWDKGEHVGSEGKGGWGTGSKETTYFPNVGVKVNFMFPRHVNSIHTQNCPTKSHASSDFRIMERNKEGKKEIGSSHKGILETHHHKGGQGRSC
jgi:hypothetical protein